MIKPVLFLSIALSMFSCAEHPVNSAASYVTPKNSAAWELVSTYRMPPSEGAFTVKFEFTSDFRVWSRGSSDSKANQMMFSDDFGKSWKFVNLPGRGLGADGMIQFVDSNRGWAIDSSTILKTDDGGMSWTQVRLPPNSKINKLDNVHFTDANHGFLAGSTTRLLERGLGTMSYGIEILCTASGGENWSVCYRDDKNGTTSTMLSSGETTMALIDQKHLLITRDGGMTWKEEHLDFPATDIEVAPNGWLWTTGEDGFIRWSTDFGDIWQKVPLKLGLNSEFRWTSISFDSSGFGVAVGSQGEVVSTADQGRSWRLQSNLNLRSNLWTVRAQRPFIAVLDERQLTIFRMTE